MKLIARALLFLMALSPAAATATPGYWSVLGVAASGDWGGDSETDRQATVLSYRWGRSVRLGADLEYVRVRTTGGLVAQTLFGPVAAGAGPGGARGGTDGDGGGKGPGPGVPPAGGAAADVVAAGEDSTTPEASWNAGLGDLRLSAVHTLVGGRDRALRVDAELGVQVPIGDVDEYLGTGEWSYRLGAAARRELLTGRVFGGLGWNWLGDPPWAELEDVLDVYAGYESDPLSGGLVLAGWLDANQEVIAGDGERMSLGLGVRGGQRLSWRVEVTTGLSGPAEDLSLAFGVGLLGAVSEGRAARGRY